MTILVTGVRGMIGSCLVWELLSGATTVVGMGHSGEEIRTPPSERVRRRV